MKEQDNPTRSKGCGIVEYETAEQAAAAINTLNDKEVRAGASTRLPTLVSRVEITLQCVEHLLLLLLLLLLILLIFLLVLLLLVLLLLLLLLLLSFSSSSFEQFVYWQCTPAFHIRLLICI